LKSTYRELSHAVISLSLVSTVKEYGVAISMLETLKYQYYVIILPMHY